MRKSHQEDARHRQANKGRMVARARNSAMGFRGWGEAEAEAEAEKKKKIK